MRSRLFLFFLIAVLAQAKTMAADTMSPQVLKETVVVPVDSVSRHHRCATESTSPEKVLWVVDGMVFDNVEVTADDIQDLSRTSAEEVMEKILKRNGVDCGKVEKFTSLPGNVAMSVYPNYGELTGAIIITTEKGNLNKKKEE
jgi:hypothetical protein